MEKTWATAKEEELRLFFPPGLTSLILFLFFLFLLLLFLPPSLVLLLPLHPAPDLTMASALKLGTSTLRSSIAVKPAVQSAAFNGLRAYSTGKAKVRCLIRVFLELNG